MIQIHPNHVFLLFQVISIDNQQSTIQWPALKEQLISHLFKTFHLLFDGTVYEADLF